MDLLFALLLDRLAGEPARFHPLVGFGILAEKIEARLNKGRESTPFSRGIFAWLIAVVPVTFIVYQLNHMTGGIWLSVLFGWLAIGWRSLREHGQAVARALASNDLHQARIKTSYLVSRDTSELGETALSKATIESLLENGNDAIIAPIFWLLVLGAPGVVFYRLCNTLDAMWGYHNSRFENFGKFTARVDDLLNYVPARMTALLYVLTGHSQQAWKAWQTQGNHWYSPNAGPVMASGAGALSLRIGGDAVYHGTVKSRIELGFGKQPAVTDIARAIQLVDRSVYLVTAIVIATIVIMNS